MNDMLLNAIITTLFTVVIGCLSFVFSQIYYKTVEKYNELKNRTSYILTYYANVFSNPINFSNCKDREVPTKYLDASDETRQIASEWRAFMETKPRFIPFTIRNRIIKDVSSMLIGLSNSTTSYSEEHLSKDNREYIGKIKNFLKLNRWDNIN